MPRSTSLTREQARQIDRQAIDQLGIPSVVLMENAGRGCVDLLERLGIAGPVAILCGKGNNGGDGLVIARHLWIRGYEPRVLLVSAADELAGDAATNYHILARSGGTLHHLADAEPDKLPAVLDRQAGDCAWLVDALLGTGVTGAPRPPYDALIEWANAQSARRLAVDVPSGLDCDTGEPHPPTFRADHTATFVGMKVGYGEPSATDYVGQVHVVEIGIPPGAIG